MNAVWVDCMVKRTTRGASVRKVRADAFLEVQLTPFDDEPDLCELVGYVDDGRMVAIMQGTRDECMAQLEAITGQADVDVTRG